MLKFKKIQCPLYFIRVIFVECDSPEELKKRFDLDAGDYVHGHTFFGSVPEKGEDWQAVFIVLNHKSIKGHISGGVLAHEALHATNMILQSRGVVADFDNDEPQAYLLQHIFNEAYAFYKDLQ